jgi:hypothetical protein
MMVGLGALLTEPYELPCFHDWAFAHGSFFVISPIDSVLCYYARGGLLHASRAGNTPPGQALSRHPCSWLALLSVIFSSLGFLSPFASAGGIVAGHMAWARYRARPERSGSGMAFLGLIVGYVFLAYLELYYDEYRVGAQKFQQLTTRWSGRATQQRAAQLRTLDGPSPHPMLALFLPYNL